jgi:hypothetical protein
LGRGRVARAGFSSVRLPAIMILATALGAVRCVYRRQCGECISCFGPRWARGTFSGANPEKVANRAARGVEKHNLRLLRAAAPRAGVELHELLRPAPPLRAASRSMISGSRAATALRAPSRSMNSGFWRAATGRFRQPLLARRNAQPRPVEQKRRSDRRRAVQRPQPRLLLADQRARPPA